MANKSPETEVRRVIESAAKDALEILLPSVNNKYVLEPSSAIVIMGKNPIFSTSLTV